MYILSLDPPTNWWIAVNLFIGISKEENSTDIYKIPRFDEIDDKLNVYGLIQGRL